MLLKYGAQNCWCFKEPIEISLEFNNNVPRDISMGFPAATAMCFKGANASGKTNALKVYAFICYFINSSFNLPVESDIAYDPFFFNDEPSFFMLNF